jgi:hypothetical protein
MLARPFVSSTDVPIRAARAWVVELDAAGRYVLGSTIKPYTWPPRAPAEARCLGSNGHRGGVPAPRCGCGLWGLASPDDLMARLEPDTLRWAVVGVVEQWGWTAVGDEGTRSEFARPLAIVRDPRFLPVGLSSLGAALRRAIEDDLAMRYDVPVFDAWPRLSRPAARCA